MDDKQLLAEIDNVLAQLPQIGEFVNIGPGDVWLGMANAILEAGELKIGDSSTLSIFNQAIEQGQYAGTSRQSALRGIVRMLHTLRHRLLISTGGTGTIAIDQGMHFQYFDAVKNAIQTATSDLLLVDPYLNEDVISKFCVFAKDNVQIRLLGQRYTTTLLPAANAFSQQRGNVLLRTTDEVHDRFVFVDKSKCILSGASFKDGPKYAPSLVTEIVDGANELIALYEKTWNVAKVLI